MKKSLLLLALLLLLSIPAIWPLFSQGFYPMHDDTQVARVFDMKEALSDSVFPVRWVENLGYGYGYPIFNFYAPLAYYVGGFFNLIGFDSLVATKIMIGLGALLASFSMYFFAREFWGRIGGLISALLYMYAPYHALNMYVRGAIAELWAYGFLPLVFLGMYKLYQLSKPLSSDKKAKTENKKIKSHLWIWASITAISYAGIILSHNLTAFMLTPFIALFAIILLSSAIKKKYKQIYVLPIALSLGILLSAFYWLPVMFEMQYTNVLSVVGGGSDYHDHFVCLQQLWNSPWAYAGSGPGCSDGLSFKIGKLHIVLGILALVPLVFQKKNRSGSKPILLGLIGLAAALFLTLEFSTLVWDMFRHMSFFQFPWRFLVLVSFFISFLGAAFITLFSAKGRIVAGILVTALILVVNIEVFVPSGIIQRTASEYTNKQVIQWQTSKISDEYMPQGFQKPKNEKEVPKEKVVVDKAAAKIVSVTSKTQQVETAIEASKQTTIKLNIAYFPAWKVFVDGKETTFKNTSTGLQVLVPKGKHTITASYNQTPIEQVGNILSLTGVIVLIVGIITQRKDITSIAKSS